MKYAVIAPMLVAFAVPAMAQTASPEPAASPQESPADGGDESAEIIVTGSRIRGTGPVGSNVIGVSATEIAREPAATITEFLRKVPQIQGFGVDASSPTVSGGTGGTNTTRGSAINLRGLGPQATLTLIDGKRLSFSGASSNYVDATAIPSMAISRIEVVPDGSSAVYGSDAVAGVVNFILNKDMDGLEVRGRYGFGNDYWLRQGGAIAGKDWGSGGVVAAYEYAQRRNLNGGDRDYIRSDLTAFGGTDYRNGQCNPGNIQIGTTTYAIPAGGVTQATAGSLVPGTLNRCENVRFADILPSEERHSGYGYVHQELGAGLTAHAQALYTSRDYAANAIQQGSTTNIVNLTVPNTNPFFVRPTGSTATSQSVLYDFTRELGLIRQTGYTRSLFLTGGLEWQVAGDWQLSVDGLFSQDRSGQYTRRVNTTVLNTALRSTDPATAFNPYGGGNGATVLDAIYSGVFNPFALSRTRGGSADVGGSLLSLPGGRVRLAAGVEYLRFTSEAGNRQGALAAPTLTLNPKLARNQKSAYAELFVPIFGGANAAPLMRRLELSAALRHDDYNDVGGTTNPKIGVNWSPVEGVVFKGSYGTSFRAPGLQDLPLLRSGASMTVVTWTDPTAPTGSSVGLQLNAGNPALTPESAETWSLTAALEPSLVPGLSASVTYFSIEYSGLIAFPPSSTTSLLNANYAFAVTRNPSAALIQSYVAQGLPINGVLPATVAFLYDGSPKNLGSVRTSGIDFAVDYRFPAGAGEFTIGANGTYTSSYDFAVTPLAAARDQAGFINFPVKFRGRTIAGWQAGGFSVQGIVNYLDGYANNLATVTQSVDSWTTVDASIAYTVPAGRGFLSGLSFGVDASNLFDRDPPFVNIQGGFDPGQASAVGRVVALSLSRKF